MTQRKPETWSTCGDAYFMEGDRLYEQIHYSYFGRYDGYHWYLTLGGTNLPELVAIKGERPKNWNECLITPIFCHVDPNQFGTEIECLFSGSYPYGGYPELELAFKKFWVKPNNLISWSVDDLMLTGKEPMPNKL